jgi:hypothetical protein
MERRSWRGLDLRFNLRLLALDGFLFTRNAEADEKGDESERNDCD